MAGRGIGKLTVWLLGALACTGAPAHAATTVALPPSACVAPAAPPEGLRDGFEDPEVLPSIPSGGSGGSFPGTRTRTVFVPSLGGNRTYLLRLPPQYTHARPWPLIVVLHGAGGAGTAPANAQATLDAWAPVADARGFIVLALIASGASGGWVPSTDGEILGLALADARAAYDIELTRQYLWGYSAGGHWGHGLALANTGLFAAYGVNAGVLQAFAGVSAPANALRKLPVSIRVGQSDSLLPFAQADRTRFLAAGWSDEQTLHYREFAGGHVFGNADVSDTWDFVCTWAVVP